MEYTINEVAGKLKISKDTLRYYEKIKLVIPKRKKNNYRYYNDEDILKLKYIMLMKLNNFSLEESRSLIKFFKSQDSTICISDVVHLLALKKREMEDKINTLNESLKLFDEVMVIKEDYSPKKIEALDNLVEDVVQKMIDADI